MAKRTQRAVAQGVARKAEQDIIRGISGSDIPTEQVAIEETVQPRTKAAVKGIAGVTQTPTGKFFYSGTEVPVAFGTPAFSTSTGQGSGSGGSGNAGGGNKETPKSFIASDGKTFATEAALVTYENNLAEKQKRLKSAFNILPDEFRRYGFEDPDFFRQLTDIIKEDVSDAEVRIKVRSLPAYERRFGAIKKRIAKGLNAISEAEFLQLEDQYSNVMRRFGLPESYYAKQVGRSNPTFETLIESDVSPVELEERVSIAQNRLFKAPPEVMRLLSDFYAGVVSNGDALAHLLDPKNALNEIQRKVTAAEIGAGAAQAGLGVTRERAEELGRFGITGEQARTGFQTVAGITPRGGQLASFYGEAPLTQSEVESEVFGTTGAVEAKKRRERLVGREVASFSGSAGTTQGALSRERAGQF